MVGLGLAMARPDCRVAVIAGDGDVLMALGSLATIGAKQPSNLSIICLDNAHYAATGMQPSATAGSTDLAVVAKGCGFKNVVIVSGLDDAEAVRQQMHADSGPMFVHARVDTKSQPRILPTRDGYGMKHRFIQASAPPR
jgi:thiamine pyrophosphate-dependent acetolactate synthase large subunit-like protein